MDRYSKLLPCISGSQQNHAAAAWTVATGARQWFELPNLLIQPILPPENTGTTSHAPYTALTLSLAHVALRRLMLLALAADADGWTSLRRKEAREKAAASTSQLGRSIGCCAKDALFRAFWDR